MKIIRARALALVAVTLLAGCQPKSGPVAAGESTATTAVAAAVAAPVVASQDTAVWVLKGKPVRTASGLAYWDARVGDGALAQPGKAVRVHYVGRFQDGTVFDQSYSRGEPIAFRLGAGQVIKGWEEGIAGMKVGGRRKLVIPPSIGYGAAGYPGAIPPNATLVFQVELVGVQ
jgi:FKBP-type peptidyl-prolyl cis-trans isomerase